MLEFPKGTILRTNKPIKVADVNRAWTISTNTYFTITSDIYTKNDRPTYSAMIIKYKRDKNAKFWPNIGFSITASQYFIEFNFDIISNITSHVEIETINGNLEDGCHTVITTVQSRQNIKFDLTEFINDNNLFHDRVILIRLNKKDLAFRVKSKVRHQFNGSDYYLFHLDKYEGLVSNNNQIHSCKMKIDKNKIKIKNGKYKILNIPIKAFNDFIDVI